MRPPAPAVPSALALALLALAACAAPADPAARAGAARDARRDGDAAQACRAEADRVVLFRDRGQLMREDDLDARVGLATNVVTARATSDRLGRQFERDRLAAECLRARTGAGPDAAAGALGAPSPPLR